LRPLAGDAAYLIFSLGILGTGLLAVPILAGSSAYAVGEAMRWPIGLERPLKKAKAFYAVIAASTSVGLLLNILGVDPIRALYLSAVLNGVLAAPVMAVTILLASNPKVMKQFVISRRLRIVAWVATGLMFAAAIGCVFDT
jgi:Mn2+/Fe2+ NRAMP family transporter